MKRYRRLIAISVLIAGALVGVSQVPAASASGAGGHPAEVEAFCETHVGVCPDNRTRQDYEGNYVGHDEPALLFYSRTAGSGNSNTWDLRLPREAPVLPRQDGTGGTWNFQRSVAFWFGMD